MQSLRLPPTPPPLKERAKDHDIGQWHDGLFLHIDEALETFSNSQNSAPFPAAIPYLGSNVERFLEAFSSVGGERVDPATHPLGWGFVRVASASVQYAEALSVEGCA